jgi:hydroxyethylthiazole kinase-like uncharacterized protein yjeF
MFNYLLRRPSASDDKYSRGVVGFITGSEEFMGAAILGVTAAIRTGVGMVRYRGPESVFKLVLEARPEVVKTQGRVQSWVLGSGISASDAFSLGMVKEVLQTITNEVLIIDAGALELIIGSFGQAKNTILTPHEGEARKLLGRLGFGASEPLDRAQLASKLNEITECTVLLKGNTSLIASDGHLIELPASPTELASAGTGDVLAGILGALAAINHDALLAGKFQLKEVVEVAVMIHSLAAEIASKQGPLAALDLANSVSAAVVQIREELSK